MGRRGFTLVEVLTVLALVGIVAAIAIPRVGEARDRAFIAAMKADLNHVRLAQVIYYQDHDDRFADDIADLTAAELFIPTEAVSTVIQAEDDSTWSASTSHPSTAVTCAFDSSSGGINCSNEREIPDRTFDLPGTNSIAF